MNLINNKEDIDGSIEPNRNAGKLPTDIPQSDDSELQPTVNPKVGFLDSVLIFIHILIISHRFKIIYVIFSWISDSREFRRRYSESF